jgi:predicted ATPase
MAKILGHNPTQSTAYIEVVEKANALEKIVGELVQLNQAQDEEIKRIVGEYDKLYEKYQTLKTKTNE